MAGAPRKRAADIAELRVLDSACGSGSFLIYAYQVLAEFYRGEIRRLEQERDRRLQELQTDETLTPFDLRVELAPWTAQIEALQNYPHLILETHLYGVDLDPQAAEIATVNLIMQAMADQRRTHKRLPLILNQNIKVGNSLIGAGGDGWTVCGACGGVGGAARPAAAPGDGTQRRRPGGVTGASSGIDGAGQRGDERRAGGVFRGRSSAPAVQLGGGVSGGVRGRGGGAARRGGGVRGSHRQSAVGDRQAGLARVLRPV